MQIFDYGDGGHFYVTNFTAATAAAVNGGCDIDYGSCFSKQGPLADAIAEGLLSGLTVQAAARRSLRPRMRLGMFDAPGQTSHPGGGDPWAHITMDVVDSAQHRELAARAAAASYVLLKNINTTLPLTCGQAHGPLKIAVLGPAANSTHAVINRYTGKPSRVVTMLQGIRTRGSLCPTPAEVTFVSDAIDDPERAALEVSGCHVAIAVMTATTEGESHDREEVGLPGQQSTLLAALARVPGLATVLVLVNGGAVDVSAGDFNAHAVVPAIVETWQGGEEAGTALASLLFGDTDFSGRLPVTVTTAKYAERNNFLNMSMLAAPGRTHRFLRAGDTTYTLYPFGHGLSYASWSVSHADISALAISTEALRHGDTIRLTATIQNTGADTGADDTLRIASGDRSVLVFVCRISPSAVDWPFQWLASFTKVRSVRSGDNASVSFELGTQELAPVWDSSVDDLQPAVGTYRAWISDSGKNCNSSSIEFQINRELDAMQ